MLQYFPKSIKEVLYNSVGGVHENADKGNGNFNIIIRHQCFNPWLASPQDLPYKSSRSGKGPTSVPETKNLSTSTVNPEFLATYFSYFVLTFCRFQRQNHICYHRNHYSLVYDQIKILMSQFEQEILFCSVVLNHRFILDEWREVIGLRPKQEQAMATNKHFSIEATVE